MKKLINLAVVNLNIQFNINLYRNNPYYCIIREKNNNEYIYTFTK